MDDFLKDLDKRPPVLAPTYYPDAPDVESAVGITLGAIESREVVDIKIRSVPAFCISGKARAPTSTVRMDIAADELPGALRTSDVIVPGQEGQFRVCGLHEGSYRFAAADNRGPEFIVREKVTLAKHDITDFEIATHDPVQIPIEIVWDGASPDQDQPMTVGVAFRSLDHGTMREVTSTGKIPRQLPVPLSEDDYVFVVGGLLPTGYVKDVTYGGRRVHNQAIHVGVAGGELRIALAHDGERIHVTAEPDSRIDVIPVTSATTMVDMHVDMLSVRGDEKGWITPMVAPGKYYVIVSDLPTITSVEVAEKLWGMLACGRLADMFPGPPTIGRRVFCPAYGGRSSYGHFGIVSGVNYGSARWRVSVRQLGPSK